MRIRSVILAPFKFAVWCASGNKFEAVDSAKRIKALLSKRDIEQMTFAQATYGWTDDDFRQRKSAAMIATIMHLVIFTIAVALVFASFLSDSFSFNQALLGFGCALMFASFVVRNLVILKMLEERRICTLKHLFGLED